MNKNTIVRVKIPMALYESIKGKVLNEAKKPVDAAKKKAAEKKKIEVKKLADKKAADLKKKKLEDAKKAEAKKLADKKAEAKKKVTEGTFSSIKKALSFDKQYQSKQDVTNAISGLSKEFKHLKFSSGDRGGIKASNGPMSYIYNVENFEPTKQVITISVNDDTYRKVSTIESDSDSLLSKVKKDIQSRFGK